MDSLAGEHLQSPGAAREVLGLFGPHTGGVDDPVSLDGQLVAGLQVDGLNSASPAASVLEDLGDPNAAGSGSPVLDGGTNQRDHEAGVVDTGVVELDGADEGVLLDLGETPHGPGLGEVPLDRHGLAAFGSDAREGVVHADANRGVGALDDGGLQRPQEGLRLDEVRGDRGQQPATFPEGLGHQLEIEVVKVAKPAVHQPGRTRRRSGGPVLALDDGGAQAAGRGVESDPCAGDAATNDEDIEFLGGHGLKGCSTLFLGQDCHVMAPSLGGPSLPSCTNVHNLIAHSCTPVVFQHGARARTPLIPDAPQERSVRTVTLGLVKKYRDDDETEHLQQCARRYHCERRT